MATSAATGPTAIVCVPRSSVLAWAAPRSVIGTPVATSRIGDDERQRYQHEHRDRAACPGRSRPGRGSPRRPRITASMTASPQAGVTN